MRHIGTLLSVILAIASFAPEARCDDRTKNMIIGQLTRIGANLNIKMVLAAVVSARNKLAPNEVSEILDTAHTLRNLQFDCPQLNQQLDTSFSREPFCILTVPKEPSRKKSYEGVNDIRGVFRALNAVIASYNQTHDKKAFIDNLKNLNGDFLREVEIYSTLPSGEDKEDRPKCASESSGNPVCMLSMLSHVTHKIDEVILDDPDFIRAFSKFLQDVLYNVGYVTKNLHVFIKGFAADINRITRDDYVEIRCGESVPYHCGRALWPVTMEKHRTRMYIFRTKAGTADPDEEFFQSLLQEAK